MSRVTSPHDAHMPSYWGWLPAELQMMILNYRAMPLLFFRAPTMPLLAF